MLKTLFLSIFMLSIIAIVPSSNVYAASGVGRIVHTYGPAWIERGDTREKARKGRVVLRNDSIITGPRGRVKLMMGDGSKVYVGAKSRISLRKYSMRGKRLLHASINMLWGKARFFVNKLASRESSFRVRTSTAVLGVRGTEFSVWSPATDALLSRAFDNITIDDIPPLPTRAVLMEGAVDIDSGSGIQYRLTPGNTADIGADRRVKVRKTNNEDLEETSRPLAFSSDSNADGKAAAEPESQQPKAETTPTKTTASEQAEPKDNKATPTKSKSAKKTATNSPDADSAAPQPGTDPTATSTPDSPKPKPEAAALPDNPQASDAVSIMLSDDIATPLDQPSLPPPPAVAAPAVSTNTADLQTQDNGTQQNEQDNQNTAGNNTPNASNGASVAPAAPAPPIGGMNSLIGGGLPIDTQAIENALQNIRTDAKLSLNFVAP